jgi:Cu+-exporting ATPase
MPEHHDHHHHAASSPSAAPPDAIYTCPMHPQIRQIGPGHCPICGMTLEPVTVAAAPQPDPEYAAMSKRLWLGLALTAPVVVLDMAGGMLGVPVAWSLWVQAVLASIVVLGMGWPFFRRGWASLSGGLNMFTLIALGTGVAWSYSLFATIFPGLFPGGLRDADGLVPVYYEAASVITVLALLGQVLELSARARTAGAVRALLDLSPKTARRLTDAGEEDVILEAVMVGDRLRVRPGESVPVDGIVEDGRSAVDESMVTGESAPVTKAPGASVIGGTINRSGTLVVRAEKVGRDSMLARIVAMVAEAQRSRAPIQRLADKVSGWFVPVVIAVAAVAFVAWMAAGPQPRLAWALTSAVAVLIIACPCALGLATPMSIMVGVGRGAQAGVLVRGAEALERMETVDTLVVDKTGTLTEGRMSVTAIVAQGMAEGDLLRLAAAAERSSEHPLGAAIVAEAVRRNLALPQARDFESPPGQGVRAMVEDRAVLLGNHAFLENAGIDAAALGPDASVETRWHPHRDADRRQPRYRPGRGAGSGHRGGRSRNPAPAQEGCGAGAARPG